MPICEYGCGKEASYKFQNGKWCCSKNVSLCQKVKERIGNKNKGNIMPFSSREKLKELHLGKKHSQKTKEKMKESHKKIENLGRFEKGLTPWNKGLTKNTDERIKIYSQKMVGNKLSFKHKRKMSESKKELYSNKTKHPSYKGEYYSNNIPLYNTYAYQLTVEENSKRDIIDENILTVECSFCRKRFIPTLQAVSERVRCLKGTNYGECRLYCSEECKNKCQVFGTSKHLKDSNLMKTNYASKDYQTFRKFVLERDSYICQFCGEKATDVHHERPQKLEPLFTLDPDYAWSCCKKCHYEKGHKDDCSTGNIAKTIC